MDQAVAQIIERLGLEAARVWPQVILVTYVTSLFWVITYPVMLIVSSLVALRFARGAMRYFSGSHEPFDDRAMAYTFGGVVLCSLWVIVAVWTIGGFPDALVGVLYPEATTVMHLAKAAR